MSENSEIDENESADTLEKSAPQIGIAMFRTHQSGKNIHCDIFQTIRSTMAIKVFNRRLGKPETRAN